MPQLKLPVSNRKCKARNCQPVPQPAVRMQRRIRLKEKQRQCVVPMRPMSEFLAMSLNKGPAVRPVAGNRISKRQRLRKRILDADKVVVNLHP